MKSIIQARLDSESQLTLARLVSRLGWIPSRIVREGLRLLGSCYAGEGRKRIAGLGQFSSGVEDLGSNKKHLKGFGR